MKLIILLFSILAHSQCDSQQISNLAECQMRTTFHCGGESPISNGEIPTRDSSRGLPGKRGQKGERGLDGERGTTGKTGEQGEKG